MELVDGKTLKEILKDKGKLDSAEAADLILQIAGALVYAEGHGLVHRDIKPDNIMLTSANVAKLCDLGLAKLTTSHGDSFQTQAGMTVGTPHYISPEQTRGEADVDTRSDIYSLGATFYHLLTGTTPFNAPTSASVMALHLTDTAPNPCDIDHNIPVAYGQILSKMMAKDVSERYLHAQDLVKDLELVQGAQNARGRAVPRQDVVLAADPEIEDDDDRSARARAAGAPRAAAALPAGIDSGLGGGDRGFWRRSVRGLEVHD